jgi:hypothetical protein
MAENLVIHPATGVVHRQLHPWLIFRDFVGWLLCFEIVLQIVRAITGGDSDPAAKKPSFSRVALISCNSLVRMCNFLRTQRREREYLFPAWLSHTTIPQQT